MSELTIRLSDKADALIAQLQKEIFNRRRKKVSASGVVETLVESGAKSQSDKRFATSWTNLIADIEKAAKLANVHGAKPSNLSDEEWALILSHRSRGTAAPSRRRTVKKVAGARKATAKTATRATKVAAKPAKAAKAAKVAAAAAAEAPAAKAEAPVAPAARRTRPRKTARSTTVKPAAVRKGTGVARRMAKAVSRLGNGAAIAAGNGTGAAALSS